MNALEKSLREIRGNHRQQQAMDTRDHCVVLAPPGSGKTKLLATRLAFDLATEIAPPRGAACITLTNAAAEELRDRVNKLGVQYRRSVFIGTVHSFALSRIVRNFAQAMGRPELLQIGLASSSQRAGAYSHAINTVFGKFLNDKARKAIKESSEIARQRLTTGSEWNAYDDGIYATSTHYEQHLRSRGLWDFQDAVRTATLMVEASPELRSVLSSVYPRIYVDEYQDLAPGLDRLVRALCLDSESRAPSKLFAVGDPDQAVFAFTGTSPELLYRLRDHALTTAVILDVNYRSGQTLIDIAAHIRGQEAPVSGVRAGGKSQAIECPDSIEGQISEAIRIVNAIHDRGVELHKIAIICPWNSHCAATSRALRSAGIPSSLRESSYSHTRSTQMIEDAAVWTTLGAETSGVRLAEILQGWRSLLGENWTRAYEVDLTRYLLAARNGTDESFQIFVDGLVFIAGGNLAPTARQTEELNELRRLINSASDGDLQGLSVAEFAGRVNRVGRVALMNMIVCKGLEFDHVIVLGLDEEIVPDYRSMNSELQLAEDRRKFYVAITRAREELYLLYSGFVVTPWGEVREAGPCRYLDEIHAFDFESY